MFFIVAKVKSLFCRNRVLAYGITGCFVFLQSGYARAAVNDPVSLEAGFSRMYNLDFSAAHSTFERWQELHPEDPLGPAANAAAYMFAEFERLHILEIDLFTEKKQAPDHDRLLPDPQVKVMFDRELSKADDLAAKILAQSSDDRNALFARVFTAGLRGNYAALVEKKKGDALDFLKSSRSIAEKLIRTDPAYYDAYLAVGIENYLLGLRSAPARWILRLSGAQTSKDKGVANLTITAQKGRYLAPYARLLLAIAALRDRDRKTAKKLLAELAHEFPQNHLYQIELGRLQS
jgi:hypothetical protein